MASGAIGFHALLVQAVLVHGMLVFGGLAVFSVFEPRQAIAEVVGEIVVAEPVGFRLDDYRKPVPQTLAGAKGVLTAEAAKALMDQGAVFLDVYPRAPKPPNLPASTVWREPPHRSIAGARWIPNVGYGVLAAPTEAYFNAQLVRASGGDLGKPLVFFCLRDCWMSWNAAKRAIAKGYSAVFWFPEGSDAWEETGYPIAVIEPVP